MTRPILEVAAAADMIRRQVVEMCGGPAGGHLGGSLSLVDILTCLYFDVLRIDPDDPDLPDRDILLLSKGHGAIALYATLAERGFLPRSSLDSFAEATNRFMSHPVRAVPGVELPTGSLGHGLGLGLGVALAARVLDSPRRTFVVLGDGELQEGSCWEAAAGAAAQGSDRLIAVVDRNGLQLTGDTEEVVPLEPLADRWRAFGWSVREVDGHNLASLRTALSTAPWDSGRPSVVIARTTKGYGVTTLSGTPKSHYIVPTPAQQVRVRSSLEAFLRTSDGHR